MRDGSIQLDRKTSFHFERWWRGCRGDHRHAAVFADLAGLIALVLCFSPMFGAVIQAIPLPVMGDVSIVVFGLIAITLVLGTGDFTVKFSDFALGGIGTATFGTIGLYALLVVLGPSKS